MPKVSVLTAVYNGERYLAEAIDSVLSQSFRDFEFLLIDDGSTDRSREIIESYRDPRIRLVVNESNMGLASSLNRGLGAARGEYVARQDADDLSEPARLARQAAFLDAHPDVALVGSGYTEIDADGAVLSTHKLPRHHEQIAWALWFYCPFVHSAVMFRRSVVPGRVGPYDESLNYSMDFELWRRVASRSRVANLGRSLVRFRTNPWSMTATYGERSREGVRMRIATLAGLLGWSDEESEDRFEAIRALASGQVLGLTPADLELAAEGLAKLEGHFNRERNLTWSRRLAFRGRLRRLVGATLMKAAVRNRNVYTAAEAFRLASLACRWHAPAALAAVGTAAISRAHPPLPVDSRSS